MRPLDLYEAFISKILENTFGRIQEHLARGGVVLLVGDVSICVYTFIHIMSA